MKLYLKQFMEWVIGLKRNIFEKARIRLTLYYIAIMVIVIGLFSYGLIFTLEKNIQQSFTERIEQTDILEIVVNETNNRIETLVFTLDGLLLFLIGIASYFLAGKTLKPIKRALDSQKRFSADASHDLRTPLAIIITETEVALQDDNLTIEEYKKVFKSNLEEASYMSALIDDLLLIARTEQKLSNGDFVAIKIGDFIEKIVEKMQIQVSIKNISLKTNIFSNKEIKIQQYNFERAIQNIIKNAINYTANNGKIIIDIAEQKSLIIIKIVDTGVGISESDLPHVFDRFYKASHSRNDNSGSGLGLPIAKQIIEQHRGSISIESKIDIGTTVIIKIPKS